MPTSNMLLLTINVFIFLFFVFFSELLSNTASLTTTNRPIGDSHSSMHTREPFEKAYKVYHVLGKGGFGIVYAGVRNHDGLQVAIKHIAKAKIKDWGQVSHFL